MLPPMTTTRRTFLKVVGAGAVCTGLPLGCPATGIVDAGNVSDLTEGEVAQIDKAQVLVGRDAGGIYAMTALCTHFGCDLSGPDGTIDPDGTVHCGCHGSAYHADGTVLNGPAVNPLQHLEVTIAADGAITVDLSKGVGIDVRAPVPAAG